MVNVFYISPGGIEGRGGIGRLAKYLSKTFVEESDALRVTYLDPYGSGSAWAMPFLFLRVLTLVFWACLFRRVDVIHLHMSFKGSAVRKLILLRVAHALGCATILHLHGSEFEVFCRSLAPRWLTLLKSSMAQASRIVVIGEYWRDVLVDFLGLPPARIEVIYNGVPLPAARTDPSEPRPCAILTLGVLSTRKGTPELLAALASPSMAELEWTAVIAGNGDVERYRAQALSLGLTNRVVMPGWIGPADAAEFLAKSDIFVLPSHNEGLPVAILEAMANGLPVISTPVGAIGELVRDGEVGLLVPPGDADALSRALVKLIRDAELRTTFGRAGRAEIESKFTIEVVAAQLEKLYRSVVDEQR